MLIDKTEEHTQIRSFGYCTTCEKEAVYTTVCGICYQRICYVCDSKEYNKLTLCTKCWDAGKEQREQIHALEYEIEALYTEWRGKCQ